MHDDTEYIGFIIRVVNRGPDGFWFSVYSGIRRHGRLVSRMRTGQKRKKWKKVRLSERAEQQRQDTREDALTQGKLYVAEIIMTA